MWDLGLNHLQVSWATEIYFADEAALIWAVLWKLEATGVKINKGSFFNSVTAELKTPSEVCKKPWKQL